MFASIQRNLDGADPARPLLYLLCDERIKSGGDNPDNRYYVAAVSDAYEYLLTADFSGCTYYSIVALDRKEMTTGLTAEERAKRAAAAPVDSDTCSFASAMEPCSVTFVHAKATAAIIMRIDERTNLSSSAAPSRTAAAPSTGRRSSLRRDRCTVAWSALTLEGCAALLARPPSTCYDTCFLLQWLDC